MSNHEAPTGAPVAITRGQITGHNLEVSAPAGFVGRVVLVTDEVGEEGKKRYFVFAAYVTHSASPATISISREAQDLYYADLPGGIDAGLLKEIEQQLGFKHDPPPPGVINGHT